MSRRRASSPSKRGKQRWRRRRTTATARSSAVLRRPRGRRRWRRRFGAPQPDSFDDKGEEVAAVPVLLFDLSGRASIAGDGARPWCGAWGEKRGELRSEVREQRRPLVVLIFLAGERRAGRAPGGETQDVVGGLLLSPATARPCRAGGERRREISEHPPGFTFLFTSKSYFLFLLFPLETSGILGIYLGY